MKNSNLTLFLFQILQEYFTKDFKGGKKVIIIRQFMLHECSEL